MQGPPQMLSTGMIVPQMLMPGVIDMTALQGMVSCLVAGACLACHQITSARVSSNSSAFASVQDMSGLAMMGGAVPVMAGPPMGMGPGGPVAGGPGMMMVDMNDQQGPSQFFKTRLCHK